MPFYTYRLTYRGQTKTVYLRKSNPKGWIGQVVEEAFPGFKTNEPALFAKIVRSELTPDAIPAGERDRGWRLRCNADGSDLSLHVVETKG